MSKMLFWDVFEDITVSSFSVKSCTQITTMIHLLAMACTSQCLPVTSLWEAAASKSTNVHEAFKPETEALTHETKVKWLDN